MNLTPRHPFLPKRVPDFSGIGSAPSQNLVKPLGSHKTP